MALAHPDRGASLMNITFVAPMAAARLRTSLRALSVSPQQEPLGNFVHRQFFHFVEDEDRPQIDRHPVEQTVEKRTRAPVIERLFRPRRRRSGNRLQDRGLGDGCKLAESSPRGPSHPKCDAKQEGFVFAMPDLCDPLRIDQEDLLQGIVRALFRYAEPTQQTKDESVMLAHPTFDPVGRVGLRPATVLGQKSRRRSAHQACHAKPPSTAPVTVTSPA